MKKHIILTLMLLTQILISTTLIANPYQNTLQDTTDIPTWYPGDSWTYTINPLIFTSPNGSFTGTITNLKQTVSTIETIAHDTKIETIYNLTITGNIIGDLTYESITGELQGTITGYSQVRQADLAELTTTILSSGTIRIYFIYQPYTLISHNTFQTPFELYDFPITPHEQWTTITHSSNTISFTIGDLINDTYTSNTWIDETIYCTGQEAITIPAGTFQTYHLTHGSTTAWYAPAAGNLIKTHINQTDGNTTIHMTMSLTTYTRVPQPTTFTTTVTPNPTLTTLPLTITGTATNTTTTQPLNTEPINLYIAATNETYTTTTNTEGTYVFTINSPILSDNTPTTYDIASDGIRLTHPPSNSYYLTTLILRENTPPTPPIITGKHNGKINTPYTYEITSTDPEDDALFILIDWGDGTTTDWQGPYPSTHPQSFTHTWTEKNTYTITSKTKDYYNAESNWSQFEISMPQSYSHLTHLKNLLTQFFCNRFPHLINLLNTLRNSKE